MLITTTIDAKSLVEALARLKQISVGKVVRNASRDFAQAAHKATPVATRSKSEFYKYYDRMEKVHFLHESQVAGRKRKKGLRKVRIHKGWSKTSWLGVFRALGMSLKMTTSRLPSAVERLSSAVTTGSGDVSSKTVITDYIRFDNFGSGTDNRTTEIARQGFALASKRITNEVNRAITKQWGKR